VATPVPTLATSWWMYRAAASTPRRRIRPGLRPAALMSSFPADADADVRPAAAELRALDAERSLAAADRKMRMMEPKLSRAAEEAAAVQLVLEEEVAELQRKLGAERSARAAESCRADAALAALDDVAAGDEDTG